MYSSTLPSNSALDGGGWSAPLLGRFTPRKNQVLIVQESGWNTGQFLRGAENLASTGIRFWDRPARSESLYQLSYPDSHKVQRKRSNSEDSSDLLIVMQGRTHVSDNARTKNLKLSHKVAETYR